MKFLKNNKIKTGLSGMRYIKAYICVLSIIAVGILTAFVGINAAEKQKKEGQSQTYLQETRSVERPTLKQVAAATTEPTTAEETMAEESTAEETQAQTQAIVAAEPKREEPPIIQVEDLVIAEEDLSNEDEVIPDKIEVVDPKEEEKVELPTSEISKLVYGIDVSKWQGNIDWAKVKASGIDFAMIKMGGRSTGSSGELYVDSCFEKNIEGALANGIQVGVYFFSQAVNEQEALEEASMIINYIKKYKITYPVAFDWESAAGYRVDGAGVDRNKLTNIVSVFCDTVAGYGYTPMTYFCRNDWYNAVNADVLTAKYKTWLAVYFKEYYYTSTTYKFGDDLPNFNYPFNMWQYGVSNAVDGINGYVDMNIAFFTYSSTPVNPLEPKLYVSNPNITININEGFDIMEGVSSTNFLGYDATDNINYVIIDKDGDEVDQDYASSHGGKYKIQYSFLDPTGKRLEEKSELIVRDTPDIYYNGEFWPGSEERIYEFTSGSTSSAEAEYELLISGIHSKVQGYSFEKKEISTLIENIEPSDLYTEVDGKKVLKEGTYYFRLYFDDGKGLGNTKILTVIIEDGRSVQ